MGENGSFGSSGLNTAHGHFSFKSTPVLSTGRNSRELFSSFCYTIACVLRLYLQSSRLRPKPGSKPSSQANCPTLAKFRPVVLIISSWQLISVPRTIHFCCPFSSNCAAAHQQRWAEAHCSLVPSEFTGCHQLPSRHISLPGHRMPYWVGRARGRRLSIQCIQMYIPRPWKFMRSVLCHITSGPNLVLACACTSPSVLSEQPHRLSKGQT